MEEIIIGKKKIPIGGKIEKKKILFYNSNQEILIYEDGNKIIIPSILMVSGVPIEKLIYEKMKIHIDINLLQELIKFIRYQERLQCINGKLNKIEIEKISEYYSYYMFFSPEIVSSIIEITNDLNLKPNLISISDFLNSNISNSPSHFRHKIAVEELDKRLKYIRY